jgi:hypothetical protein
MQAGIAAYKAGDWFTTDVYNWDLVCNAGLLAGAIAFIDATKTQASAASVYANASADLIDGFSSFGPDGAWPEGTTYWGWVHLLCRMSAFSLCALHSVHLRIDCVRQRSLEHDREPPPHHF